MLNLAIFGPQIELERYKVHRNATFVGSTYRFWETKVVKWKKTGVYSQLGELIH